MLAIFGGDVQGKRACSTPRSSSRWALPRLVVKQKPKWRGRRREVKRGQVELRVPELGRLLSFDEGGLPKGESELLLMDYIKRKGTLPGSSVVCWASARAQSSS